MSVLNNGATTDSSLGSGYAKREKNKNRRVYTGRVRFRKRLWSKYPVMQVEYYVTMEYAVGGGSGDYYYWGDVTTEIASDNSLRFSVSMEG